MLSFFTNLNVSWAAVKQVSAKAVSLNPRRSVQMICPSGKSFQLLWMPPRSLRLKALEIARA
jgi:hypothetical protein